MKKKFISVILRLSFEFMIILSVAVLILSIAFVGVVHSFIRSEQGIELENSANIIENIFENKTDESGNRFDFSMIPSYVAFNIYDLNGKVILSNSEFMPKLSETNEEAKIYFQKDYFLDGDLNILYLTKKTNSILIQVSMNMERDTSLKLYKTLPKSILLTIFPILLISFGMAFFITKRTMSPVTKITKAARKISSSNLGELLPLSEHDDEINQLAETFNKLFVRLKADFEQEKQFTSDVSHELKTPIAVISGQVGLLLRWGKDDKAQLEKSLETIKKETKSMQSIVENLLQMSRLERGTVKPNFEQVDISEMFERIKDEFKIISPTIQIDCKVADRNNCKLKTDSELLHQVMTVIVSNSVKYAGNDCKIILNSKIQNSKMQITIEDNGKGFAEETLPHVFERFYRGDESHTRSVGGSGLGLSIAKTIVEALNGTISAENSENHGARLILNMQMQ